MRAVGPAVGPALAETSGVAATWDDDGPADVPALGGRDGSPIALGDSLVDGLGCALQPPATIAPINPIATTTTRNGDGRRSIKDT